MPPLTPFARGVAQLHPSATGSDMAAMLDHKAKRTTVLQWYAGRANAPRWALQLLATKIRAHTAPKLAIAAELDAMPERPGLRAGAKNLANYLARRT